MATGYQGYAGYDPERAKLDRSRRLAEMLQEGALDTGPKSFWEGAAQLGKAFIARGAMDRADKAEAAYGDAVNQRNSRILSALMPDAQGVTNNQMNAAAPFDLTPNGFNQRSQIVNANEKFRPLAEEMMKQGDLGGVVGMLGDQEKLAMDRAKAQREASAPLTINNRLVDPNSFAVLGDYSDPTKPVQPKYNETTLADGVYYVNETDPNDKIRLGPAPKKAGEGLSSNPAGLTDEQVKTEIQLSKDWGNVASEWQNVSNMSNRARAMASRKDSVGDLQLVIALTKLADPGTAAREGEVQMSQQTASLVDQASNWIEKLKQGNTLLPDSSRTAMIEAINEMEGVYNTFYEGVAERTKQRAQAYGFSPDRIFLTMQPESMRPAEQPKPTLMDSFVQGAGNLAQGFTGMFGGGRQSGQQPVRVNSPQERDALPSGTRYIAPDGSVKVKK